MIISPSSFGLFLLSTVAAITTAASSGDVYRYNVCNGLSNQMLYHSASIATAIEQGYKEVEIPDYFIVNGEQESSELVVPTSDNSIAFSVAFDSPRFLSLVKDLGINARFVKFHDASSQPACAGVSTLQNADPSLVYTVMEGFQPSASIQQIVDNAKSTLESDPKTAQDAGICLHYRGGDNWKNHCDRWSSVQDGSYKGNCMSSEPLTDSLVLRGADESKNWIFFAGDESEVPEDLKSSDFVVKSRQTLLSEGALEKAAGVKSGKAVPELDALVDYFICNDLSTFVGNSVSSFSAIQIAMREGEHTFWYNTQGIPLADFWPVYNMPIVYTYTELSQSTGKHMLMASIGSVRSHMPESKIHILYHGNQDAEFQDWLKEQDVIVHAHDPTWRSMIEEMRQHGDASISHLFEHEGNYFGTWQRIDVPFFVDSEYVLFLDSDTVIQKPFTISDFGQDLTKTLAMSSEIEITNQPVNAGVMLMNVPYMRKTYQDFFKFIAAHVQAPQFNNPFPSDQGAYLEFYSDISFLSRCFNFKPYYRMGDIECDTPFVLHFHGAKPHDYLKHLLGEQCPEATRPLCEKAVALPSLCRTMQVFARASQDVDSDEYCEEAFSGKRDAAFCNDIMDALAEDDEDCPNIATVIRETLVALPYEPNTPKETIFRMLDDAAFSVADAHRLLVSQVPSSMPSKRPSSKRVSEKPSKMPSRMPSRKPSSKPSRKPSSKPSRKPSSKPSRKPSSMPVMPTGDCLGKNAKCTGAKGECCKKFKCYGKKLKSKGTCGKCAKEKMACKKTKDCCKGGKAFTCQKNKCGKCLKKNSKCTTKDMDKCCSGKCVKSKCK